MEKQILMRLPYIAGPYLDLTITRTGSLLDYWKRSMWEFPKIRGFNMDPKYYGSCYKDTHKQDPNL